MTSTEMQNQIQIQTKFTEHANAEKALSILDMNKKEIKETFWDNGDFGGANANWSSYFLNLKRYLKRVVRANGTVAQEYKFGKMEGGGRLYVDGGGVQTLQHQIRNYLCGEYYYDFDICNCHPSILLHICTEFNIEAPCLRQYVASRNSTLSDHGLTKKDILVAINQDKNKAKRDNRFYNSLIFELHCIKPQILQRIAHLGITTSNEKNPISSVVNKYILRFEGDIIQTAARHFGSSAEVLMFDGIMVNKSYCAETVLEVRLAGLNEIFAEKFGGLIEFKVKPTETDIVLKEMGRKVVEYEVLKPVFEESHFLTIKPFAYWKKNKQPDGSFSYNQIKESNFRNACEEFQIVDFNGRDELVPTSIFKKWMIDPLKRKYECIDFCPYGLENKCPKHVFNTFGGFEVNKIENHETANTDNFNELVLNLCNHDEAMADYLLKYIAHMFQFPNRRTEQIIVLKGWTGTGKDSLFRTIQRLMGGRHADITENPETLFGNFNDIMDSKVCLFINELEGGDGIKYQEKLKAVASNLKNKVNGKFQEVVEQSNYCRLFVNSNNDGCVNVQVSDRRYVIIRTGMGLVSNVKNKTQKAKAAAFWGTYYNSLSDPNWRKSLYEKMMGMDLSDFNGKHAPVSEEKSIMREKNINPIYTYMKEMIGAGKFPQFFEKTIKGVRVHLIKWSEFTTAYKAWVAERHSFDFKIKDTMIKQKLVNMDNSFTPDRKIIHDVGGKKKKEKFACFDMVKMGAFLDGFVFTDCEDEGVYVGELGAKARAPAKQLVYAHLL
jgi:hypothetical protein